MGDSQDSVVARAVELMWGKKDTGYLYKAFVVARRPIIRLQRLAQQRENVEKNLVSNYGTFVGWLRKQNDPCGLHR